ncbi:MAG: response regulator [bacterium]
MNKRILILEDEKPMLKALTIKLESESLDVVGVSDASDFFQKIEEEKFDLILLDLMLPGMSGFDVLEKLKEGDIKTPVIIASNLGQKDDKKRALDLGAVEYLVKSETSLTDIVKIVKNFLK